MRGKRKKRTKVRLGPRKALLLRTRYCEKKKANKRYSRKQKHRDRDEQS